MKKIHLIISAIIVIPVGCIYGFNPDLLFDVKVNSTDEANIFKAIMGLYFSFSFFWILGILKSSLWKSATISNIVFMLGLALGRVISMISDGVPSNIFVVGTLGELVLGFYGLQQLKKEKSPNIQDS